MQYLTYEEYIQMGGTLDNTAFSRCINRATAKIRFATSGRIDNMQIIPDEVKDLSFDMVSLLFNNSTFSNISSISQSAGGVSESKSFSIKSVSDIESEQQQLIMDYLGSVFDDNGTPLLYKGVFA